MFRANQFSTGFLSILRSSFVLLLSSGNIKLNQIEVLSKLVRLRYILIYSSVLSLCSA